MTTALKINGADISHHQGGVLDFTKAKRAGLEFLYHKATEGNSYVDDMYKKRRAEADKAKVPFGAYHFARPETGDAAKEAKHFLDVAKPKPGDLLPVLDLEDNGKLNPQQLDTWARTFVETVTKLTGFKVMVYTPFALPSIGHCPLWVARYSNTNTSPVIPAPWKTATLRQFSNGVYGVPNKLPGFGAVDLNTYGPGASLKTITIPLPKPVKPLKPSISLTTMHFSLQYSDSPKQQVFDAEKIFAYAEAKETDWVTGTEAGEVDLWAIVREAGTKHGYQMHRSRGNWVAVRQSIIKKGSWEVGDVFVMDNDNVDGHGHDPDFPWVTFEHRAKGVGVISIAAIHYPTSGRIPSNPNHWVNKAYAEKLSKWGKEKAQGRDLAFVHGDFNMPDQNQIDLFFDGPFTTYGDELKKWPTTGHGPIDAMATWDSDGRVKVLTYDVLDDKIFFLNTDHFGIEGTISVELLAA